MNSIDLSENSFWRDLLNGRAGVAARIVVNLVIAIALGGICPIVAYLLAAFVPAWGRGYGWGVHPSDELIAGVIVAGAGTFVIATVWLWAGKWRGVLRPTVYTVGIGMLTASLVVLAAANFRGEVELVVVGLILLGIAAVIIVWIGPIYRLARGRPVRNLSDGLGNVHCPRCNYRMVGLSESRCPECETQYTLDELLAKQNFSRVG